jgi:hypothetical protein
MFYILQFVMIVYAIASARQEKDVVQAFLDYVPIGNKYSKGFHNSGAFMTTCMAAVISLVTTDIVTVAISFFLSLLWYWIVFDIALNKYTGKNWDYIGQTAKLDKALNQMFPHGDGGEVKAIACLVFIILLNLLHSWL